MSAITFGKKGRPTKKLDHVIEEEEDGKRIQK